MEIVGKNGTYSLLENDPVAEASNYRLYLCSQLETGRKCLLQIASDPLQNGGLARGAFILKELERIANELEQEYTKIKTDPKVILNYGLHFPELLDSFIFEQQKIGRQVNILAFRMVEEVQRMVPLTNITTKDRLRIDLKTSAWILGKSLKTLTLTQSEGITIGLTTGENIVIEPDEHYVVYFDWSQAFIHRDHIPSEIRKKEIVDAAQAVIVALGGDIEAGTIPEDGEIERDVYDQYTGLLWSLAQGEERSAETAHKNFYRLVKKFWKGFHPFTTKPL